MRLSGIVDKRVSAPPSISPTTHEIIIALMSWDELIFLKRNVSLNKEDHILVISVDK